MMPRVQRSKGRDKGTGGVAKQVSHSLVDTETTKLAVGQCFVRQSTLKCWKVLKQRMELSIELVSESVLNCSPAVLLL